MPDLRGDVVIFDAPGYTYIGVFGDGSVYRWPAERGGWQHRKACMAPVEGDLACEMRPKNAQLALVLSGVERAREK